MATRPRAKMPVSERAKQFSSFKALSGLELALEEKRRELGYEERRVLSEDDEALLNATLTGLRQGERIAVRHHDGKRYVDGVFTFETVDEVEGTLIASEGVVRLANISDIHRLE